MADFIVSNWYALAAALLVFLKVIANLTYVTWDNRVFEFLDVAINYRPAEEQAQGMIVS